MAEPGAPLLPRLASIVGEAHVLTADADIEPFVADWRGRYRGTARAVVLPVSTEEVAAVVRACAETGTSIVPQGGNTGLCGGAIPDERGRELVVALRRMNRVRISKRPIAVAFLHESRLTRAGMAVLRHFQKRAENSGGGLFASCKAARGANKSFMFLL